MSQPRIFEFVPEPCWVPPSHPPPLFAWLCIPQVGMPWGLLLPVRGDVAEVLSLPIQALIAEKAFFLLKQKANCPVPAGANMQPVLCAGWERSVSRFVGENAGTHMQPAD